MFSSLILSVPRPSPPSPIPLNVNNSRNGSQLSGPVDTRVPRGRSWPCPPLGPLFNGSTSFSFPSFLLLGGLWRYLSRAQTSAPSHAFPFPGLPHLHCVFSAPGPQGNVQSQGCSDTAVTTMTQTYIHLSTLPRYPVFPRHNSRHFFECSLRVRYFICINSQ